jgi:hypothetical protein
MASVEQAQTVEQELPSENGSATNGSTPNGAHAVAQIEVENPATGEIVASAPTPSPRWPSAPARRSRRGSPTASTAVRA